MTFVPDLNILLAYTAAAVILVITPGPDMTLFLGQTLTGGRARGIAAYLGASAGVPRCSPPILSSAPSAAASGAAPRLTRAIDYLFASLMGAFAGRLLCARSN